MDSLIMIGQFSEITATSKRMLRHYDKMEILKPVLINQDNGYRFYSQEQVSLLYTIKLLQGFGFSLSEISSIIKAPTKHDDFLDMLKDKEAYLRNQIDGDVTKLVHIRKSIEILNTSDSDDHLILLQSLNLERSSTMMKKNDPLNILAMKQQLYALPGYSLFEEQINDYVSRNQGQPVAFVTFDIDNFAPINDQYGFDVGDKVIYKYYDLIAQTFTLLIQDGHGTVARLGGDEVAFFLHNITVTAITDYAEKALEAIRSYDFTPLGYNKQLTSTCGLYYTGSIDNIAELRHNSTKALMEGKRNGRDQLSLISK